MDTTTTITMTDWRNEQGTVTHALRKTGERVAISYRGRIIGWIVPGNEDGPHAEKRKAES